MIDGLGQRSDEAVFLLGGAGADLLGSLLGEHPDLCCLPRTRLVAGLIETVTANLAAVAGYGLPEQYWWSRVGAFFDGLQRDHAARHGKRRWVYLVEEGGSSIDQLDRMFPRARFVQVVDPHHGRRTRANRRAGARLWAGRYFEVKAPDLGTQPEVVVRRVLAFLGEEYAGPHDARPAVVDLTEEPTAGRLTG